MLNQPNCMKHRKIPGLRVCSASSKKKKVRMDKLNKKFLAAAKDGKIGEMNNLLKAGADPNAKDEFGNNALILTTGDNNLEAVRFLLDAGTNPKAANKNGWNVLKNAVIFGYSKIVKIVLEQYVPTYDDCKTALDEATFYGYDDIAGLIIEKWGGTI
jgi:ankyrin repeat protein